MVADDAVLGTGPDDKFEEEHESCELGDIIIEDSKDWKLPVAIVASVFLLVIGAFVIVSPFMPKQPYEPIPVTYTLTRTAPSDTPLDSFELVSTKLIDRLNIQTQNVSVRWAACEAQLPPEKQDKDYKVGVNTKMATVPYYTYYNGVNGQVWGSTSTN